MVQPVSARNTGRALKEDHLPFLDGFRGLAALWVVAFHSMRITGAHIPVINEGLAAVQVFMIMSGFLMAYHYYARQDKEPWEKPLTWKKFYIRRFFRIAPLYYALLMVYWLAGPTLGEYRKEISQVVESVNPLESRYSDRSLSNILWHVSFLFGASPVYSFHSPMPDWSIGLEMQFYLVFPFVMLLMRGKFFYIHATIIFVACKVFNKLILKGAFVMPSFLTLSMVFFLIGILLAVSHRFKDAANVKWPALITAFGLAVVSKQVLIVGITGVIMFLLHANASGVVHRLVLRLLSNRLTAWMADLSYCVYLLHMLFLLPAAYFLTRMESFLGLAGPLRFLIVFVVTVVPVYLCSMPIFHFLERKGIAIGKQIVVRTL